MKIVFLGTPDFAVPSLRAVLNAGHEVAAVVTQPDRPRNRGGKLQAPPLKLFAEEQGLQVLQFEKIRTQGVEALRALSPDIMVTAAYGQILSQELLDIAPHGVINVHGSLLPKYRGAAPIQWAVINGEKRTGVTIMQTEAGLDCGDILYVEETDIGPEETAGELFDRLSELGGRALVRALELIESGLVRPVPQDEAAATHCKMLTKEAGRLDFSLDAVSLHNLIRGVNPWPVAFTAYNGQALKVYASRLVDSLSEAEPGTVIASDRHSGLVVACGKGCLRLTEVQTAGGKRMDDIAFLNGYRPSVGTRLGAE